MPLLLARVLMNSKYEFFRTTPFVLLFEGRVRWEGVTKTCFMIHQSVFLRNTHKPIKAVGQI